MLSPRENNMHKLCEKKSYGARHEEASTGCMDGRGRPRDLPLVPTNGEGYENKKVNFIELLVIYLISVFIMLSTHYRIVQQAD